MIDKSLWTNLKGNYLNIKCPLDAGIIDMSCFSYPTSSRF